MIKILGFAVLVSLGNGKPFEPVSYGRPDEPSPDDLLKRGRVHLFTSSAAAERAIRQTGLRAKEAGHPWIKTAAFRIDVVEGDSDTPERTDDQKLIDAVNLVCEASKRLPSGWLLSLNMTRQESSLSLNDPTGDEVESLPAGEWGFSALRAAVETAIEAEGGGE